MVEHPGESPETDSEADDLVASEDAPRRIGRIGQRPFVPSLLARIRSLLPGKAQRDQEPDFEELADADDLTPPRPLFPITIDGKNYNCERWQTAERARTLERRYDQGFAGGMGAFSEHQALGPDQHYIAVRMDPTAYPYIRLRKRTTATIAVTEPTGNVPSYGFIAEDSGGTEYFYLLSGRRAKKIDLATNAVDETKDFGAGAVCGRPELFEGSWRVPLGDTVDWQTLTTVAVPPTTDTWTTATVGGSPAGSRKATHFAQLMIEGTAELWRSHNADDPPVAGNASNRVSGSADAITFGGSFEVGDDSLAISDLISLGGQLIVMRPEAPYRFSNDGGGNAYPVHSFVGRAQFLSGYTGEDGSNSGSHSAFAYWTSSSGLWRIFGDNAVPIDPQSDPKWSGIALDGLIPSFFGRWSSFAAWGRWAYAVNDTHLFAGYVLEDGSIRWHGILFDNNFFLRVIIVASSSAPIMFLLDSNSNLHRIDLEEDGSTRRITTPGTNRGGDSETAQLWMPATDLGEPEKNKQLRMMWIEIDDFGDAEVTLTARIHRDRAATSEQVGASKTSADGSGRHEFALTPGTNDSFRQIMTAVRLVTTASWNEANGDPRIVAFGLRAITPTVYRATIPLDAPALRGGPLGTRDALTRLRNLRDGASIAVREPGQNVTFTGYVVGLSERTVHRNGRTEHLLEVDLERWVL